MGVVVSAVAAALVADYQVAQAAPVVAVPHVALAATSPEPVLCEPAVAVAAVLPLVHLAVAVALVAPSPGVRLSLRQSNVQLAADVVHCLRRVAVARQDDLEVVRPVAVVPLLAVVPPVAAVLLFVLPDARHALGTSVPSRDRTQDSRASPSLNPDGTAVPQA